MALGLGLATCWLSLGLGLVTSWAVAVGWVRGWAGGRAWFGILGFRVWWYFRV